MKEMFEIKTMINEYLDRSPSVVKENANHNFAISGLKSHIASTLLKHYTMGLSPAAKYHNKACLHLHDSDGGPWSAYCRGLDLLQILQEGIKNPAGTSSGPAKHFDVAVDHIVNSFYVSQNEWEGAQAFSNADTLLAPFVRSDNLTQEEVTQGMQRLVFNLSFPLRSAFQTPFTNLSFDLTCPDHMKNEPVIIGGLPTENTYGDFQDEMDMINLGFLEVMLQGDKNGNPHTFPIGTYSITKDFRWDHPVTDKLFELTSKFGLPYFMNYIKTDLDPSSQRAMCCLTFGTKIITKGFDGIAYRDIGSCGNDKDKKVLINGKFENATWIQTTSDKIYNIKFSNGIILNCTPDHPCVTKRGIVKAENLTSDDWVPFSLSGYEGDGGSYDLGRFIGLYLAEGSKNGNAGIRFAFSIKEDEYQSFVIDFAKNNFGAHETLNYSKNDSGEITGVTIFLTSQALIKLVDEYIGGKSASEKYLRSKIFKMNKDFRCGVLDGEWGGDGSKEKHDGLKRISTSSKQLADDLVCLFSSVGNVSSINEYDRTLENKGIEYNIHKYTLKNDKWGDIYIVDENKDKVWFKVCEIKTKYNTGKYVYDFEMNTEDHIFQLANGLITHNCRLQMDLNEIIEISKGGLWNSGASTGSLSVVTINMPQIGYLAHKRTESPEEMLMYFYNRLDTLLDGARDHNIWKREKINEGFEMGLMPFTKSYLPNFNSFFSTIGIVGMNECCLNMYGKPIYECTEFVEGVLKHIHKYVRDCTKQYGYPWNFEETPAEGCSHSLAVKDKAYYGDIITSGEGDGVYYTNSSHINVGDEVGLADSLKIQEKFKQHYNGGTLFHIFMGENSPNPAGAKDLIRNICENTKIPYIALTRAYAVCPGCGVIDDLSGICPKCNNNTTVFDRVTGFYRPVDNYNPGKTSEFANRQRFDTVNALDLEW